ncbi:hypothetical protein POSPLADRAFT_1055438 [Postia placenta MAD-698-R-SB12]|uniref:Uncharacterized protein n=1 Tax=Postia placenta MAD-698-R-SB12 TaxID=670580 RepID=A0A1X6N446_9APHY|nr:hypothetical protein POSPLADRAFT_1055438 [Postia placenta MAD-698-R-SB12]OSX63374.1 hypothetical protein POSPLADRAFT_1055438 [Postia placenta MAD-698-R-SB12]
MASAWDDLPALGEHTLHALALSSETRPCEANPSAATPGSAKLTHDVRRREVTPAKGCPSALGTALPPICVLIVPRPGHTHMIGAARMFSHTLSPSQPWRRSRIEPVFLMALPGAHTYPSARLFACRHHVRAFSVIA